TPNLSERIAGERHGPHFVDDSAARVDRRHAFLNFGSQLLSARWAHARLRHRAKRFVMFGKPLFVTKVTRLLFFHEPCSLVATGRIPRQLALTGKLYYNSRVLVAVAGRCP